MPYGNITVNAKTFIPSGGAGRYVRDTVTFGAPMDYLRVSGGSRNSKTQVTSAAVTRVLEKDVTVGSDVTRRQCTLSLVASVPQGFDSSEIDAMALEISEFLTPAVITRWLLGES